MRIATFLAVVFRILLGSLAAAYFVVALAILATRYVLLPNIGDYLPDIERVASRLVKAPVRIGALEAQWDGLHPELRLEQVRLFGADEQPVLVLPRVDALLSWRSLVTWRPELLRLQLHGARLDAGRNADGSFSVAGWRLGLGAGDGGADHPALEWLMRQKAVDIRGAQVRWHDRMLGLEPIALTAVQGSLRHDLIRGTRFALAADGPPQRFAHVEIRGEARRTLFGLSSMVDVPRWRGRAFIEVHDLDLAQVARFGAGRSAEGELPVVRGRGWARAWLDYRDAAVGAWRADLVLRDYAQTATGEIPALAIAGATVRARGDAADGQMRLELDLHHGRLDLSRWFERGEVPIHALQGSLDAEFGDGRPLRLRFGKVRMDAGEPGARARVTADGTWRSSGRSAAGTVDLHGAISGADAGAVGRFMPTEVGPHTREWLRTGITAGEIGSGQWRLRGDLADFPFDHGDPEAGDFFISGPVRGVTLDIEPNADDPWPRFEEAAGTVTVSRSALHVAVDSGVVRQGLPGTVKIGKTTVDIPRLHEDAVLTVQGQASADAPVALAYVNGSPLAHHTGHVLSQTAAQGNVGVALRVVAPLSDLDRIQVTGEVRLAGNTVRLRPGFPPFSRVNGVIAFADAGVVAQQLEGRFLGGSFQARGATKKAGGGQVEFSGRLDAAALRQFHDAPGMQRLRGTADYRGTLVIDERDRLKLNVTSPLQGLAMEFPAPLAKPAEAAWPLQAQWSSAMGAKQTNELRVTLVQRAEFIAEFGSDRGAQGAPAMRAALGVDQPARLPRAGLHAQIRAAELDLDDWREVLESFQTPPSAKSGELPFAALATAPFSVNIDANKITVWDTPVTQVRAQVRRESAHQWRATVSSEQAEGTMSWQASARADERRPSMLQARFSRLSIESRDNDTEPGKPADAPEEAPPSLDLLADDFQYNGRSLGKLLLQGVSLDQGRRWRLRELRLDNPDATLVVDGNWRAGAPGAAAHMALDLDWQIRNAGGLLGRFGMRDVVAGGHGQILGSLGWQGAPTALDPALLDGRLEATLEKGRFLNASATAGRLLGILSLQSLARAATFQPGNLFESGYAWDQIHSKMEINDGVARIGSFLMQGPSAAVELTGQTNLGSETQNFVATIAPRIDASAAALIAGIAVNPVVGLGAFLTQWLLSHPLEDALAYRYRVTGTWSEPRVERINADGAALDNPP